MFKDKKIDKLYHAWHSLVARATNKYLDKRRTKSYTDKKIGICDEWLIFDNFKKWALENGYDVDLYDSGRNKITIDRIDNSKGYSPKNCRFISHRENQYNKDNTVFVEYQGEKYNLLELSKKLNLPLTTIHMRYFRKGSFDKKYMKKKERYYIYKGEKKSLIELSKISGIPIKNLFNRLVNLKWSVDEAMSVKKATHKIHIKLYEYNGKNYCIADLAKLLGVKRTTLQYRISHNLNYDGSRKEY